MYSFQRTRPRGRPTDSVDITDQVAVDRVRAGDRQAYAVLVRKHAAAAHRAAVVFGAGPDAEDVVQVAFVKAYEALPTLREGAPYKPWLLRIVRNEALNTVRAITRRQAATDRLARLEPIRPEADPADVSAARDRRHALLAAIDGLPDVLRQVVVCRFLLELTEHETATVLSCPAGTVKSRLHRALTRLRRRLEPTLEVDHEH